MARDWGVAAPGRAAGRGIRRAPGAGPARGVVAGLLPADSRRAGAGPGLLPRRRANMTLASAKPDMTLASANRGAQTGTPQAARRGNSGVDRGVGIAFGNPAWCGPVAGCLAALAYHDLESSS